MAQGAAQLAGNASQETGKENVEGGGNADSDDDGIMGGMNGHDVPLGKFPSNESIQGDGDRRSVPPIDVHHGIRCTGMMGVDRFGIQSEDEDEDGDKVPPTEVSPSAERPEQSSTSFVAPPKQLEAHQLPSSLPSHEHEHEHGVLLESPVVKATYVEPAYAPPTTTIGVTGSQVDGLSLEPPQGTRLVDGVIVAGE